MREFFRKVIGIDPEKCLPEYRVGYHRPAENTRPLA